MPRDSSNWTAVSDRWEGKRWPSTLGGSIHRRVGAACNPRLTNPAAPGFLGLVAQIRLGQHQYGVVASKSERIAHHHLEVSLTGL